MNIDRDLERRIALTYGETAPSREPDGLLDDVLLTTSQTRQRPTWLASIKEPPMRISHSVAVGSPTLRVAAIVVATLLITLLLAGAGLAGSRLLAADGTIVVDQAGSGHYETINEALAEAEDGDTIMVKPGTYLESLVIDKDITLRGDGPAGQVVIAFDSDSPTLTWDVRDDQQQLLAYPFGLVLEDSEATLANLTIRGPELGLGIKIVGGAPVVDGVSIELAPLSDPEQGDFHAPLWIGGGSTATIIDSTWDGYVGVRQSSPTIENNVIGDDISIDGPGQPIVRANRFVAGSGVGTSYGGSALIESNDFEDGYISVDTGSDPTIRGNVIHRSTRPPDCYDCAAIWISQYDWSQWYPSDSYDPEDLATISALVEDNQISRASMGIYVNGIGATPTVRGNAVRDSDRGMFIFAADPLLEGNTVDGGSIGLMVQAGSPTLNDNSITGVAGRGLIFASGARPTLSGNVSCSNETNLYLSADADPIDTAGNTICEDAPSPGE